MIQGLDSQLFDDQLEVWTLIIQKSMVIPPSLMVLFNITIIIIQSFVLFTMVIVRLIFLRIHHANLQKGNLEGQEKLSQFLLFVVLVLPMVTLFTIW